MIFFLLRYKLSHCSFLFALRILDAIQIDYMHTILHGVFSDD